MTVFVKIEFIQVDDKRKTFTRTMHTMTIQQAIDFLKVAQKQQTKIFIREIEGYDK